MVGAVFSPYLGHLNGWPFLFRKPPKRDGGHGLLALFWQSQTQRKRGDYDDTRNSGYDLCRHRTDNGLRIWSSPTVSNLTKEKTQGEEEVLAVSLGLLATLGRCGQSSVPKKQDGFHCAAGCRKALSAT